MTITQSAVDLALGLDVCHSGVRQVRLPEHPDVLNQVEIVTSARHVVHDLLITLARALVDDPTKTGMLLTDVECTDALLHRVDLDAPGWDPIVKDCSWETAYDRAASDRDAAEQALLAHLAERTVHNLDAATLQFTVNAARQFAAQVLIAAADAETRQQR